jgi:ADP-heptose:LPS heptosyltransferase
LAIPRDRFRAAGLRLLARALPPARPAGGHPRRLLLIRPDHVGDVLLTSPAIAALRAALPQAHLTLMVGPWSEAVARRGAAVDRLLSCEFPGFTRRPRRGPLEPYRLLLGTAERLRGDYDLAVVLRPDHWWGALLARLAGVPLRLGYDTPNTRPFLTEALPLPCGKHAVRLNMALAERACEIATGRGGVSPAATPRGEAAGGEIPPLRLHDAPKPVFRLTAEERGWAATTAEQATGPLVLLHPGSGSPLKSWPVDRWAALADELAWRGVAVALTGGADDLATPLAVAAAMRAAPLMLAGKTTLGQFGALAERSALVVGTDSGPLHLAAAVGAPTVRVYGPTDEAIFGPWGPPQKHVVLVNPLPCRPCGNLVAPPCAARAEPPCLLGVRANRVLEASLAQLTARLPSPRGRAPG